MNKRQLYLAGLSTSELIEPLRDFTPQGGDDSWVDDLARQLSPLYVESRGQCLSGLPTFGIMVIGIAGILLTGELLRKHQNNT